MLIRAVAREQEAQLIIVGHGDRKRALEALITTLNVQDRVVLSGLLPDKQLQALMATADCFCLPSVERTEAFGLVLLEAMRFGKMLIVSDVPGSGMGWVVQDGITGSLFNVGDVTKLTQLLTQYSAHPKQRNHMGVAAKERFQSTFHIDQVAEKTIQLYNNVLAAR